MTLAENQTEESEPNLATDSMFPDSATSVTPIIRMLHSSDGLEGRPRRSSKNLGASKSNRALEPKTTAPAVRTARWYLYLFIG